VLAAGLSSRMGKPKQTLRLEGGLMLEKVLIALGHTQVDRVVVVLGAQASELRSHVKFGKVEVVVNPRFREGMSGSIKLGLATVEGEADAAIIVLGDQPFVSPGTIDRLIDEYRSSKASVVVPVYHGTRGNPVLFDKSLFPQIKKIIGDAGAKSVVAENEEKLVQLVVEDKGILIDIDTPSEYSEAVSEKGAARRRRTRGGT
jgi:molybdenum cofactor cytidylyltransferase